MKLKWGLVSVRLHKWNRKWEGNEAGPACFVPSNPFRQAAVECNGRMRPKKNHSFYQFTVNLNLFLIQDYANNNDNMHANTSCWSFLRHCRCCFFQLDVSIGASWWWNSWWYLLFHHNQIQLASQQQLCIMSWVENAPHRLKNGETSEKAH